MRAPWRKEISSLSRAGSSGDRKAHEGDTRGRIFPGRAGQAKCTELVMEQVRAGALGGTWKRIGQPDRKQDHWPSVVLKALRIRSYKGL